MRGGAFPVDADGRPVDQWWTRVGRSAAGLEDAPVFTNSIGLVMRTADVRMLARRVATAAGIDPEEVGAKSFRAGGATDWRECLGDASAHIVKQRGRWESDVALVYQRPLLSSHLAASLAVRPGGSADLEALCAGFAQAAVR